MSAIAASASISKITGDVIFDGLEKAASSPFL
jgi:hypothetical protein